MDFIIEKILLLNSFLNINYKSSKDNHGRWEFPMGYDTQHLYLGYQKIASNF